ncbi:hypothetical protein F5Y16DRAFT_228779 [Xylariaceae sp. FL0255]|nr:hypothetical protein F5Y16DRAFT_228779 [Xylariaceae sp. FL0255]
MTRQWIIPRSKMTMIGMLVIAVLLAVGHHLFYKGLMGKPPPDSTYSFLGTSIHLSGQQINLAVGTLLAFLVKAFLGVAVSTAHEQHVWNFIKTHPTKIAIIDGLFLAKSNVFTVFNVYLWGKSFVSMLLALVFWLLPIASFLTPASLTVHQALSSENQLFRVPRVDFTSLNFANIQEVQSTSLSAYYAGPQLDVQQIVKASATASQILPIPPSNANSSWALHFHAPALSCQMVNTTLLGEIKANIYDAVRAESCQNSYGYLSWVPLSSVRENASYPFDFDSNTKSYNLRSDTIGPNTTGTPNDYDPPPEQLSIFFATFPGMAYFTEDDDCQSVVNADGLTVIESQITNSTVAQCSLYNASYIAHFSYVNGAQNIDLSVDRSFNNVSYAPGISGAYPFGTFFPNGTVNPSVYNTSLVEMYAFSAVMESLGQTLVGSIASSAQGLKATSDITSTALVNTKQFKFLHTFYLDAGVVFDEDIAQFWNGLSVSEPTNFTNDWLETIEDLSHNITISLMQSELLQPNYSSPYAPEDTLVTVTSYKNIYAYSTPLLWAPYAVAIGISLLSIVIGTLSTLKNHASYTTKFSTILRVAHIMSFSSSFDIQDVFGEDPTPDRVKRIRVEFPDEKLKDDFAPDTNITEMTMSSSELLHNSKPAGPTDDVVEEQIG